MLGLSALAKANGTWLTKDPARDHGRKNPYAGQKEAVAAGQRIFLNHCAQCHGDDTERMRAADGNRGRPSLAFGEREERNAILCKTPGSATMASDYLYENT